MTSINENLLSVFNYSFVETAPYGFFIPKEDKYVAVNLIDKAYHCLSCGKEIRVRYHHTGVTYFSKERFAKQKSIYEDLQLEFPSVDEIKAEKEFTCHVRGFCETCAAKALAEAVEPEQQIYNLCLALHRCDEQLLADAREQMGAAIKSWLTGITEAAQVASYDLSSDGALRDLLCAVVLQDTTALEALLRAYQQEKERILAAAAELEEELPAAWPAYTVRPTAIYESMSDDIYHEYTVVFPEKATVPQDFFIYRQIEKARVQMFLQQPRIETVEQLLVESGFDGCWIDWLVDHVMTLKQ